MRKLIAKILCVAVFAAVVSCSMDHLHYETSRYALIHIELDWEARTHLEPNGVSTYVFDSNGGRYGNVVLSSDPNNVYLKLPPGDYTVVFHNNSITELSGVHHTGTRRLETFSVHADEAGYKPQFETLDKELFVDAPEDMASYTLKGLHIDSDDIEYHYYKPDLADFEQEAAQTYHIEPAHIVHTSRIIAYMNGAEFSSTKRPRAVLHGMSGGYYFGAEHTSEEDVMEEFDVNLSYEKPDDDEETRPGPPTLPPSYHVNGAVDIIDPDKDDDYTDEELAGMGVAYVDCNTFGMHHLDPDDQKYYLHMRFYLYDGTYTDYKVDVTGYIDTEHTGTNNLHTVKLILEPLPDGGGNPGDGSWGPDPEGDGSSGVFDPSLDDWVDVEVELPM